LVLQNFTTAWKSGNNLFTYWKLFSSHTHQSMTMSDSDLKVNRNIYPNPVTCDRMHLIGPKCDQLGPITIIYLQSPNERTSSFCLLKTGFWLLVIYWSATIPSILVYIVIFWLDMGMHYHLKDKCSWVFYKMFYQMIRKHFHGECQCIQPYKMFFCILSGKYCHSGQLFAWKWRDPVIMKFQ